MNDNLDWHVQLVVSRITTVNVIKQSFYICLITKDHLEVIISSVSFTLQNVMELEQITLLESTHFFNGVLVDPSLIFLCSVLPMLMAKLKN